MKLEGNVWGNTAAGWPLIAGRDVGWSHHNWAYWTLKTDINLRDLNLSHMSVLSFSYSSHTETSNTKCIQAGWSQCLKKKEGSLQRAIQDSHNIVIITLLSIWLRLMFDFIQVGRSTYFCVVATPENGIVWSSQSYPKSLLKLALFNFGVTGQKSYNKLWAYCHSSGLREH